MLALEIIGYAFFGVCALCVALMLLRTIVAYFHSLSEDSSERKSDKENKE